MSTSRPAAQSEERSVVLRRLGADETVMSELLAYTENPYLGRLAIDRLELPLSEEPHVAVWREYESEAGRIGAAETLRRRLVQLAFPIAEGTSSRPEYRAATLRGVWPERGPGLALHDPEGLRLAVHESPGGPVPTIEIGDRGDFVSLVRALTGRNEPIEVPDSMGACLVKGLINQDRVARHREHWERSRGGGSAEAWSEELRRLAPRKELYQDRLLLLSTGPYSAVAAEEMELDEEEWRRASRLLRLEHECFHYLTLRLFGTIRSNLLDELLADFAGASIALGGYRQRDALRFLGVTTPSGQPTGSTPLAPRLATGARLALYLADPPLSPKALQVLLCLAVEVSGRLEALGRHADGLLGTVAGRALLLLELATRPLEALASVDPERLVGRLLEAEAGPREGLS